MTINEKLKAAIKRKGFKLSDVASKMRNDRAGTIGISQPSLTDMLKGNIPYSRVKEIADILGVSMSELAEDHPDTGASITCPHCGKPITLKVE